ncbi:MAG: hypothetical protein AB7D29_07805 [Campylobacterales bacterium]
MAVLLNGLETVELGATAWREVYNNNFSKLYTSGQVDQHLTNKADKAGANTQNFAAKDMEIKGVLNWTGTSVTSLSATAGSATLPVNPVGFISVKLGGVSVKIPYYAE